ncbi:MAG: transposase [Proteobacteria bacterium]|nr:transposase [Pseudomonadota bacterium]
MAYLPRYEIICDDACFHVTWQCHNKDWLIQWEWAKSAYYDLLLKYKDKYGIQFYSYNFMDNHPHLTGHLENKEKFSAFFRVVNSQFARIVNKQLKRRGQVVMDRFKSPMIESDEHMLTVMGYADLNQHRARKVSHPRKNQWSSYQYYAYGKADALISPAPSYLDLGKTPLERQNEYRAIVESIMAHRREINISHTHFIGNPEWVLSKYRELCEKLGRKATDARLIRMTSAPG